MKYQGIYKIINLLNGKVYIGQSINIENRFKDHKCNVKKNLNHPLYNSIRCYGIDNFDFIIVEEINDVNKLNKKEILNTDERINNSCLRKKVCPIML